MASIAHPASNKPFLSTLSLDFRATDEMGSPRSYFVIGGLTTAAEPEATLTRTIAQIKTLLQNNGLEVLSMDQDYRRTFALPQNFQGCIVTILPHLEADADHWNGAANAGFNLSATYDKIKIVANALRVDQDAIDRLQTVKSQLTRDASNLEMELPAYLENFQPQLVGISDVIHKLARDQEVSLAREDLHNEYLSLKEIQRINPNDLSIPKQIEDVLKRWKALDSISVENPAKRRKT